MRVSLTATAIAAHVERYRQVLVSGNRDIASRAAHARAGEPGPGGAVLADTQVHRMVARYAANVAKEYGSLRYAKAVPGPVRPLDAHARAYEQGLRRVYLRPMMRDMRRGLSTATAAAEAIEAIDGVPLTTARREGLMAGGGQQAGEACQRLSPPEADPDVPRGTGRGHRPRAQ